MNATTAHSLVANGVFFALAGITVFGACVVAFGRNIVRSAFALLATFFGVAGIYACLNAELVAVIQLMVYVGGILVVMLFAVMLTARIGELRVTNPSVDRTTAALVIVPVVAGLVFMALELPLSASHANDSAPSTTRAIGDALLGPYVLPFEAVSLLLLAALVGAVVSARGAGENRA